MSPNTLIQVSWHYKVQLQKVLHTTHLSLECIGNYVDLIMYLGIIIILFHKIRLMNLHTQRTVHPFWLNKNSLVVSICKVNKLLMSINSSEMDQVHVSCVSRLLISMAGVLRRLTHTAKVSQGTLCLGVKGQPASVLSTLGVRRRPPKRTLKHPSQVFRTFRSASFVNVKIKVH